MVIEVKYTYTVDKYYRKSQYHNSNLNWHFDKIDPGYGMIENLIGADE